MKSLFLLFCLFFLTISGHAQTEGFSKKIQDSIYKIIVQDTVDTTVDSIPNIWYVEHWDTTVYNPYKDEAKAFPFQVVFKDSTYTSPTEGPIKITSRYGWRNRRAHNGIDLDLVTGDDVNAMLGGKVRFVGTQRGHGKIIVVRHDNGLETSYAHLSKQLVKVNDTVVKGQVIAKGGASGNARGSHLHLEVRFRGIYIHPEYLFDFSEENRLRTQNAWVTKNWVTPYIHSSKRQSDVVVYNTYEEAIESEKKQEQIYVVKRGDTLSKISQKYRVSITALCKTNAIKKTSTLRIGQKLVVVK